MWFDAARDDAGFKNDSEVAAAAGLNHSSISSWRGGRQRPSTVSLSAVAKVLGRSAQEAWREAGRLAPADMREVDAAPREDWGVEMIRSSVVLNDAAKAKLIETHLADQEAEREKLRRKLELVESLQTPE